MLDILKEAATDTMGVFALSGKQTYRVTEFGARGFAGLAGLRIV